MGKRNNSEQRRCKAPAEVEHPRGSQPETLTPSRRRWNDKRIWLVAVGIFTLIALCPIWSVRFLPMQDYPEHLWQVHMLRFRDDPAFDYKENFDFNLRLAPYATFYAITALFSIAVPLEVAGKLSISLYILAVTLLVIKLERRSKGDFAPWGLLLFFPFAFNQQYFQGNTNYFYSLPLLVFALLDHEDMSKTPVSLWPLCRHLLWQLVLFFTHPLTFLIYISLAGVGALLSWRKRAEFVRALISPAIGAIFFSLWFVVESAAGSAGQMMWTSFVGNLGCYAYIFTGMRWFDGVNKLSAVLWIAMGGLVVYAFFAGRQESVRFSRRELAFFTLTTIAVFVLPFRKGPYSYINARVAAISYFFLAMLVGRLRFKGACKAVFVVLAAAVLIQSVIMQRHISEEIKEIEPIVTRIPSNSRILPLVFDNDTAELDRYFFDMHLHDHAYYHLLVGGGLTPYIIQNPLFPVHYKAGMNRPAPGEYSPYQFRWEQHASDYQYFLVRSAPYELIPYLADKTKQIGRSGKWLLFKRNVD